MNVGVNVLELLELLEENPLNVSKLQELFAEMNTVDIAEVFENIGKEKLIQMFRLLPKSIAADVFSYIEPDNQQIIIEALTDSEVAKIMEELFVDDAVDFIEEMPANVVKRVLQNADETKRGFINQFLQYPEDSAGGIMTAEYVDLRADAKVREAFDYIRKTGVDRETIYTCYVIRRDKLLVGVVSAKTLMLANPHEVIGDIMDKNLIFAQTTDDQEAIAALFKKYGLLSLPVVDKEQRLVGIVTIDDVVQIIEEEATEDFEKMAAINPSDEPYLKTSVFRHSRNRIIWLMVLMLSATITASILESYEDAIAVMPVLVAFIPMLMDTAGNAGAQTSALIIRGMALGEIRAKDIITVLWKELRVSIVCGLILGLVNFARVYLMNGRDPWLSLTLTITILITVVIAKTVGCLLPIIAKKIRLDPATMAAPVITSIADAFALIAYFLLAKAIFGI
jgi:magnesium transporter